MWFNRLKLLRLPFPSFRSRWLDEKPLLKRSLAAIYWMPIGLAFTNYLYTIKTVNGRSMQPTLNPDVSQWKDIVVFDRLSLFLGGSVQRGDVVALRDPFNPKKMLVKRIVATQGDMVKTLPPYPDKEVCVPAGHVWIEGDEPFRTLDSNRFGPVPIGLLDSILIYIVWPLDRIGPLRKPTVPFIKQGSPRNSNWYKDMAALEREQRRSARVTPANKHGYDVS
ncbi:hypothetical protein SERLA73DRAFT_191976 [Serpula lacrymans var. lacrymans S7.3]|uniref:Mitochondrial inner membrane protease subunit 2 n=2 Tax=Serpula lacrymans var. lacrymans TaxID=341189 RepID=F8QIQ8_SERL3|nr:uncharacterized protein SERLADRAFT_462705 [Serpula lacrymans var. lacrymans S7.9]EGN91806.1 hypothetical protein SERLA73DRAFT_191976 [Serpula lacrymans var. lacrymans S7.3]EGO26062.1 hypothetical protein SERLADRAFT_462705 [Serpula lacrymans var. lacrymans S7.9]